MKISIKVLKDTLAAKGYKWLGDRPMIIGIRTKLDVPDSFNDFLAVVYPENGAEVLKLYPITTDPGVYHLNKPMNVEGTFVLKPGQYIDSHEIGFHQGKPDHRALHQVGNLTGYRDNDKDNFAETAGMKEVTGTSFGVNIHGSKKDVTGADGKVVEGKSTVVGAWSAGCQVHAVWKNKEEMMDICDKFKVLTKNRFTYTLVLEQDLVDKP